MSKIKNVLFSATVIILIGLFFSTKTLLAHGGSHHATSEKKQENEQSNMEHNHHKMKLENHNNPQNSSIFKTKITVNMERSKNISATENYKMFNLLPETSELVFMGLIISPFLLQLIRKEIHNNDGN